MSGPSRQSGLPLFGDSPVTGVDESGRGPLAGPVVAAAVTLPPGAPLDGLADSKTLPEAARRRIADSILDVAIGCSVAWADPAEIDGLNILNATMLAMRRAVAGLTIPPAHVMVDGNRCPRLACTVEAVVGGDARIAAISAASIIAKVTRDAMMFELDAVYPDYGFSAHKGYPTPAHMVCLRARGPTPVHRRTFRPVAEVLGAA